MAKRGREGALKRQREKARQEKKAIKLEKRYARGDEPEAAPSVDEEGLMEEFARLSERFENGELGAAEYEEHRRRIFSELGIAAADE